MVPHRLLDDNLKCHLQESKRFVVGGPHVGYNYYVQTTLRQLTVMIVLMKYLLNLRVTLA